MFPYFAKTVKAKGHRWFEAHQGSEVHGRFWHNSTVRIGQQILSEARGQADVVGVAQGQRDDSWGLVCGMR